MQPPPHLLMIDWVKHILIDQLVVKGKDSICELGGRGIDLSKWFSVRPTSYLALDLAADDARLSQEKWAKKYSALNARFEVFDPCYVCMGFSNEG